MEKLSFKNKIIISIFVYILIILLTAAFFFFPLTQKLFGLSSISMEMLISSFYYSLFLFIPILFATFLGIKIFEKEKPSRAFWIYIKKIFMYSLFLIALLILSLVLMFTSGCSGEECMGYALILMFGFMFLLLIYFILAFIGTIFYLIFKNKGKILALNFSLQKNEWYRKYRNGLLYVLIFLIIGILLNQFGVIAYLKYGCFKGDWKCIL